MLAKLYSFGLNGIDGFTVEVEADIHRGMPAFETVGLPDAAIKESKERVRSAIKNGRFQYPTTRITVNLAPADQKKVGSFYDLPIALCILAASEQLDYERVKEFCFLGELALDGRVRRVQGILPIAIAAKESGFRKLVIPEENLAEASFIDGIEIYGVGSLGETVAFLNGETPRAPLTHREACAVLKQGETSGDFRYIKGQYFAKRALEIAAAGGHNILLIGPPGAGKTMLAKALPGILPDLTPAEALETTKIHSVAGKLDYSEGIVRSRPFRTPHHTTTAAALTGGGSNAHPGEISLAHNGVLYLDELPEYDKHVLETLRQPLEDGVITVARSMRSVTYPANFMMVASMNPCPCGYYGSKKRTCDCTPAEIKRYLGRISGPLLDRIDLQVEVDCVEYSELTEPADAEDSAAVKTRVDAARARQTERFADSGVYGNAKMTSEQVRRFCALTPEAKELLQAAFERLGLSARAYTRVLKVARTIADLAGDERVGADAVMEAVRFRSLDKKYTF